MLSRGCVERLPDKPPAVGRAGLMWLWVSPTAPGFSSSSEVLRTPSVTEHTCGTRLIPAGWKVTLLWVIAVPVPGEGIYG